MPLSPAAMRLFLAVCGFVMTLLAVFYLRRRALSPFEFLGWGLLALLLPVLGSYLVIAARPGRR